MIVSGLVGEQKMLRGRLPRVRYHKVYWYTKKVTLGTSDGLAFDTNTGDLRDQIVDESSFTSILGDI